MKCSPDLNRCCDRYIPTITIDDIPQQKEKKCHKQNKLNNGIQNKLNNGTQNKLNNGTQNKLNNSKQNKLNNETNIYKWFCFLIICFFIMKL